MIVHSTIKFSEKLMHYGKKHDDAVIARTSKSEEKTVQAKSYV